MLGRVGAVKDIEKRELNSQWLLEVKIFNPQIKVDKISRMGIEPLCHKRNRYDIEAYK